MEKINQVENQNISLNNKLTEIEGKINDVYWCGYSFIKGIFKR